MTFGAICAISNGLQLFAKNSSVGNKVLFSSVLIIVSPCNFHTYLSHNFLCNECNIVVLTKIIQIQIRTIPIDISLRGCRFLKFFNRFLKAFLSHFDHISLIIIGIGSLTFAFHPQREFRITYNTTAANIFCFCTTKK